MLDFSVIIPAKNEETNIHGCLDSIFTNTYPKIKYEVIVIDNGSVDRTVALAESCGAKVVQMPGVNISALRNHGAKIAQGRVLVFIDADCTVAEDWMAQAAQYLYRDDIALFGSPPGIPLDSTWVQRTWLFVRGKREKAIKEVPWLESMNMFAPRDLFLELGGFNEKLITCEDVDLSYRMATHGKVLSDINIKATHHGEARTLREFFRKERWRGKSNYAGLLSHGIRPDEIPSLVLPLYYLIMPVLAVTAWVLLDSWYYFLVGCVLWQMPIGFMALLKLKHSINAMNVWRLCLLYNVYYGARSMAVF